MSTAIEADREREAEFKDTPLGNGTGLWTGGIPVLDCVRQAAGEIWLSSGVDTTREVAKLLSGAKHDVVMTCAGLKRTLFGRAEIDAVMSELLDAKVHFRFLFSRDSVTLPSDGEREFIEASHPLIHWKERFSPLLHLFWAPSHIRREFIIVDSRDAMLEQPDHHALLPPAVIRYGDRKLGAAWVAAFDRTLESSATEILRGPVRADN